VGIFLPNDISDEEKKKRQQRYKEYNRFFGSLENFKSIKTLGTLSINDTDIDQGLQYLPNLNDPDFNFHCQPLFIERKVAKIHDQ